MPESGAHIRFAKPDDAEVVAEFIRKLAQHEHVEEETDPSIDDLRAQLAAGAPNTLFCLIAEVGPGPVGYAIAYPEYLSNKTTWFLHVQDVFVEESMRHCGIGESLMRRLAQIAKENGYRGFALEVLKWNTGAFQFYDGLKFIANPEADKLYIEGSDFESLARD